MKEEKLIETVKKEIIKIRPKPISIFIYGSYNTPEYLAGVSDLEIGVIKKGKISIFKQLRKIAKKHSTRKINLRIYPYDLNELKNKKVDSPFTKNVFIRHLILTSKTVWGEKIMENLPLPSITLLDAYREASISTMRALNGIFFLRAGLLREGLEAGSKACLFATLSLEYLLGEFPIGFNNIVKLSKKLELENEWNKLIELAYKIRQEKVKLKTEEAMDFVFNVITYCNQIVEEKIRKELEKEKRHFLVK